MARTDKDRPHWVREADPTEDRLPYHAHTYWHYGFHLRECDFRENEHKPAQRPNGLACGWIVTGEWYGYGVPKWFTRRGADWTTPVHARDTLRNMAREYNSYGDIEDYDVPDYKLSSYDWW